MIREIVANAIRFLPGTLPFDFMKNYDVVIIGGGPAGVVAAIQAGRLGASTLLVERTPRLGGTTVSAGIYRPGLFHAWGKQVIAGIGWELVAQAARASGYGFPDFKNSGSDHGKHVPVNPAIYSTLCDQYVLDTGAEILLNTLLGQVEQKDDGWTLTLCGIDGLREVSARVLIDCSGDANATHLAGFSLRLPEEVQPATLSFVMGGFDRGTIDLEALDTAFRAAIERGELLAEDGSWYQDKPSLQRFLRNRGVNNNHIATSADARTTEGRTKLEIDARQSVLRFYKFLKQQPGFERADIEYMRPETGVRETATIEGEVTITLDDYVSGRLWEDAICYSYYPVDLHGMDTSSWQAWQIAEGTLPTIPLRALIPRGSRNLLVAGRCLSSDRLANSAARVQATCMGMGQAAGVLAVLAAQSGSTPLDVPYENAIALLREHGALVPPDEPLDVPELESSSAPEYG
jgi:hypothetical protein